MPLLAPGERGGRLGLGRVELAPLGLADGVDVAAHRVPEGVHGGVGDSTVVVERLRGGVGRVSVFPGVEVAVGPRRAEVFHVLGVEVRGLGDGGLPVPAILGHLPLDVALAALDLHVSDGAGVGEEGIAARHGRLVDAPLLGVEGRARRASLQAVRLVLSGDEVLAPRAGVDVEVGERAQQPQLARLQCAPPLDERAPGLARELGALGIIPAGAGKSWVRPPGSSSARDHPRGCGEKRRTVARTMARRGSSPRVRGKGGRREGPRRGHGIIPAGAGKSLMEACACTSVADHPRGCGEKLDGGVRLHQRRGSSPRVRGKDQRHYHPEQ